MMGYDTLEYTEIGDVQGPVYLYKRGNTDKSSRIVTAYHALIK